MCVHTCILFLSEKKKGIVILIFFHLCRIVFFHGCSICYDGDTIHPLKGFQCRQLSKSDLAIQKLRSHGLNVIEVWEHEFVLDKKTNPELKEFLSNHHLKDRLKLHDSFFGGHTNAEKLYHEGDARYVDFISLYPWV